MDIYNGIIVDCRSVSILFGDNPSRRHYGAVISGDSSSSDHTAFDGALRGRNYSRRTAGAGIRNICSLDFSAHETISHRAANAANTTDSIARADLSCEGTLLNGKTSYIFSRYISSLEGAKHTADHIRTGAGDCY